MREDLVHLIEQELKQAVQDRNVFFPHPDARRDVAEKIAQKLMEGRERYRSGRRIYDRLRDRLLSYWRA